MADFQSFLQQTGFLAESDGEGVFGYRTHSAARLWYEYIRTIEKVTNLGVGVADGSFGLSTRYHMLRWKRDSSKRAWNGYSSRRPMPEFNEWISVLESVKKNQLKNMSLPHRLVDAFRGSSSTRSVAAWDFSPENVHLIGVRRSSGQIGIRRNSEQAMAEHNDDVFILLINGLVYKFFGSTDPRGSHHRGGAPFLAPAQHIYRRGWHKQSDRRKVHRGFLPEGDGVLTFRDRDRDLKLEDHELEETLHVNRSIPIHWTGSGITSWSQGGQVIAGSRYLNPANEIIDYSESTARSYASLGGMSDLGDYQHKGAYSVLIDLIWALSPNDEVYYTLLVENELDAPKRQEIASILARLTEGEE